MAAITSALIAIAGVLLGWLAIEMACKPCLERGREALDQSLNPDYDPDDDINAPLNNPSNDSSPLEHNAISDSSSHDHPVKKIVA